MAKRTTICAGIDTGKRKLDVALDGSSEQLQIDNSPEGYQALLDWLRRHRVKRIGIEASGGYEQAVVAELRQKRFVVVVFQPAQVRAYAKFRLQRAKNDKIDAVLIAACTAAVRWRPSHPRWPQAAAPGALYCRPASILSLESAAYCPLQTTDRGRKGTQACTHRLCPKAAHFRQHGCGPGNPMGPRASPNRFNDRTLEGRLTPSVSLFDQIGRFFVPTCHRNDIARRRRQGWSSLRGCNALRCRQTTP